MKLYLAALCNELGNGGRLKKYYNHNMKIFLAGDGCFQKEKYNIYLKDVCILESFYYLKRQEWIYPMISEFKEFLLDSGAFTFFGKQKTDVKKYIEEYIDFINKYNIKHFFELDLYTLPEYGIKKTEEIRSYIEKKTNRKSIPVFHKICGIDYYKKLCRDYSYIAISASGKYDSKWTRSNPQQLKNMLLYAKQKNVKVHGLGYTSLNMLDKMPFYSIDSTSWLSGNQFGFIFYFDGITVKKQIKPIGKRLNSKKAAIHNFAEWVKFQKYAEDNL